MERLKNKIAIITGAAGGMGKCEALLFAKEGAGVLATDINEAKLSDWVQEAQKDGLNIQWMKQDVSDEESCRAVAQRAMNLFGKIDILVNNAGIFPGFASCEDTTREQWDKVININLTGAFLNCKACIPFMRKSGGGSIINIASIAGIVGGNGPAYSSSKGGMRLLTKDLAVSLAKDKIRVNCICPGAVDTPMTEDLLEQPEMMHVIEAMSPQGRVAASSEIAWGALYLASDESTFTTGADLAIDGGAVAR